MHFLPKNLFSKLLLSDEGDCVFWEKNGTRVASSVQLRGFGVIASVIRGLFYSRLRGFVHQSRQISQVRGSNVCFDHPKYHSGGGELQFGHCSQCFLQPKMS